MVLGSYSKHLFNFCEGQVFKHNCNNVFCVFLQANVALFEAHCKEKIQQFEDAGSDDEIWDEKHITFTSEAQRRPRSAAQRVDRSHNVLS